MKNLYLLSILFLCTLGMFAQTPQKMNYQTVVRNSSDMILANQSVGIQISILQGSALGTAVYVETQVPTTNANGLASIEIGTGSVVSGDFTTIDWANNTYFIKTEIDIAGGTNYTITGTSQLASVPYALHAKTAESITGTLTETDPVYSASPANNITTADITTLSNTSGTNTGDQDISGIATNATDISAIQAEQTTQNTAIALNTAQTVPVPANVIQVSLAGNLSPTNSNPVGFTETLFSKGSELVLNADGTISGLKAGRTYKITAHISGRGTATSGVAMYMIYDYTSIAEIGERVEFISNSYVYTYSQKPSGISYITPTVDTVVGLRAASSGANYTIGTYTTFTVEEVIDRNSLIAQDYVLEEQITNRTWIDGKPIYEKVYTFNLVTTPDESIIVSNVEVATMDTVIKIYGFVNGAAYMNSMNEGGAASNSSNVTANGGNWMWRVYGDSSGNFRLTKNGYSNSSYMAHFIIEYTKN